MSEPTPDLTGSLMPSPIGFDGFVLDPNKGLLFGRDGTEIALRPKALELLIVLAASHGGPLGKAELLNRIWGRVNVTEDSLFQAVMDARRALNDQKGCLLRYQARRGYMLDCEFTEAVRPQPVPELRPSADRPSVAVLPFRMLGRPASDYVAAGLAEEISIALSRFRWLFVLANASAIAIAAPVSDADLADTLIAGRGFGIRYLIDGSFAEADGSILVRCRLVETTTGRQVWQDRFTGMAGDILALYEAITSAIAAAIEPRLLRAEIERVLRKPTDDLGAFDAYLRALPGYYSRTPGGNSEAIALLEMAIAGDPHFALATALLGRCVATSVWLGTEADAARGTGRALALARAALAIDRSDPQVLALCGHLLAVVGGEHDEGGALLDLSLRMNPNSAESWRLGGWVSTWSGDTGIALQRLAEAERLDPLSPLQADVHSARSAALLVGQRFAEAIHAARRSLATRPEATAPRRFLVAALWQAGQHVEARLECAGLMALQPNASLRRSRTLQSFRHPRMTDLLIDGLRGAGMPE